MTRKNIAWHGTARPGTGNHGMAWHGMARGHPAYGNWHDQSALVNAFQDLQHILTQDEAAATTVPQHTPAVHVR